MSLHDSLSRHFALLIFVFVCFNRSLFHFSLVAQTIVVMAQDTSVSIPTDFAAKKRRKDNAQRDLNFVPKN